MHLTSSPSAWYAIRASGFVAYLLLTYSVCVGVSMSSRERSRRWPMFALEDVHRFSSLLAGSFVAVHVILTAIDGFLPFSLAELVIPGASGFRPLGTALGVVGAELLVAVAITNAVRGRIPHRWWRRAHYATFAVWAASTLHGILGGSSRGEAWAIPVYAFASGIVAGLAVARAVGGRLPEARREAWSVAASLGTSLGVIALALG